MTHKFTTMPGNQEFVEKFNAISDYVEEQQKKSGGLPVGFIYLSFNKFGIEGSLPCDGKEYSRELYPDLWNFIANGVYIDERSWQQRYSSDNGNVACFSSGDGRTSFRVPSIKCYIKGAAYPDETDTYLPPGLPNIQGKINVDGSSEVAEHTGAFANITKVNAVRNASGDGDGAWLYFDASNSNPIYGASTTVQPESLVGMYYVVAFGTVSNIGNVDVQNVVNATNQLSGKLANKADKNAQGHLVFPNGSELWVE